MVLALRHPPRTRPRRLGVSAPRNGYWSRPAFLFQEDLSMRTITPPEHSEGAVARAIEQQTAKLPSDTFLWMAGGSIAASMTLKLMGRDKDALFVGQWAPTFLILGLYNKLVKVAGSD
jgi:hypothetical protein